jgi:hypothetical protein
MHTISSLKAEHKTLAAAKAFHKLKARSWAALAEKLNTPTVEELLAENAALKKQLAAAQGFDSVGFWLLDANFDRSNLEDFGFTKDVLKTKLAVEAAFKKLSFSNATPEQQANLAKFHLQLIGMATYSEEAAEHTAQLATKRLKRATKAK